MVAVVGVVVVDFYVAVSIVIAVFVVLIVGEDVNPVLVSCILTFHFSDFVRKCSHCIDDFFQLIFRATCFILLPFGYAMVTSERKVGFVLQGFEGRQE